MNRSVELALRLFSPRGSLTGAVRGAAGPIGREEILGALQAAAKERALGFHYLMADHLMDEASLSALLNHFNGQLGKDAAVYAMALLLRRPMPEQLDRLINAHPYYEAERRRASVLMERAKRAHRAGNELEYRRLKGERDGVLSSARERCATEIITTGRCPKCQGTGHRVKVGDQCPMCLGSGRSVPTQRFIVERFGADISGHMERTVELIIIEASELSDEIRRSLFF